MKYLFRPKVARLCNSCINPSHHSQRWTGISNPNISSTETSVYSPYHRFRWCGYPKTCKFLHDYRTIEKYGQPIDININKKPK